MSYSRKCINIVNEEFEAKRLKNESQRQARLNEAYSALPELEKIDKELSKTGVNAMACAMGGKEGLSERLNALKERNLELQRARAELLLSTGYAEDYTDLKYDCPICQDYGAYNGKMCSCYKTRIIEEQFKQSGISSLVKTQSFETFSVDLYENCEEMKELYNYAVNYVKNFDKIKENVLLVGGTGLGKTHISTAIAKALIESGHNVVFECAQNVFFDFESDRFLDRFGGEEPVSTKYLDCDLLIIDDLGAENISAFSVSCLYNIINTRLNKNLPIIASTNFSSKELRQKYHDRITSRLFGEFNIKMFQGKDIRQVKKTK
ncbi:MAG: ATP-binding protein [Clostridia bacterium]|nr:ATP-binding protein [Clostridia bacterium]